VAPAASDVRRTTIKVAYPTPGAVIAPLWLAQDDGIFKKYGLHSEILYTQPPNDTQALINGDVQFNDDGSGAVNAHLGGADLVYIAVTAPYFVLSLYAGPQIHQLSDLVGKTVAATSPGQSTDYALRTLMAREGITDKQIKVAYVRSQPAILAAIQSGTVQAGILSAPTTLKGRQAGLHEVVNIASLKLPTIHQGIEVRESWAKANKDVVTNFLKGYLEAIKEARSNPDRAEAVIGKYTETKDKADLDEAYQTFRNVWPSLPLVSDASIQNLLSFAPDANAKAHKPSEFYDNSYLESLQAGFLKTLYPDGLTS
jgi:ABC-type nitrate/sulfonate/bicarbonate transport system substrate-binding protein